MTATRAPLFLLTVLSLAVTTYFFWLKYYQPNYGVDDANIYFVYMRNFAEGHGFVWDVGGERVEGFTSILWTLIGAFFYKLSAQQYPFLLLALNFILTTYTIFRVLIFARKLNGQMDRVITSSDVLILAMLFFPLGFVEWSILALMETGIWLFVIVQTTLMLCEHHINGKRVNTLYFSLLLAVMVLTRPEGLLFGPMFLILFLLQTYFSSGWSTAIRRTVMPLLAFLIVAGGLILWRISYFGYPLPNTYYAKVSSSMLYNLKEGVMYFLKFLYNFPHLSIALFMLLIFGVLLLFRWTKEKSRTRLNAHERVQAILFVVVMSGLIVPVLTGGDHFKYNRFYQAIIPLMLLSLFNLPVLASYFGSVRIHNRMVGAFITAVCVIALFFIPKSNWIDFYLEYRVSGNKVFQDFDIARKGRTIANDLNQTFADQKQLPSIGVIAAGGFGYAYQGRTVDLMGLNNTTMAHSSRRKEGMRNHASFAISGFWKLNPDIVGPFYGTEPITDTTFTLPENSETFRTTNSFLYKAYKGIFDTPEFIDRYYPALLKRKGPGPYHFAYYKNDFLSQLDPAIYEVKLLQRNVPLVKQ
jgi:hypothetical protein